MMEQSDVVEVDSGDVSNLVNWILEVNREGVGYGVRDTSEGSDRVSIKQGGMIEEPAGRGRQSLEQDQACPSNNLFSVGCHIMWLEEFTGFSHSRISQDHPSHIRSLQ